MSTIIKSGRKLWEQINNLFINSTYILFFSERCCFVEIAEKWSIQEFTILNILCMIKLQHLTAVVDMFTILFLVWLWKTVEIYCFKKASLFTVMNSVFIFVFIAVGMVYYWNCVAYLFTINLLFNWTIRIYTYTVQINMTSMVSVHSLFVPLF